jgi:catechol 2,3-dioxygenase-like lactoylglutathione lyase family enzyme
MITALDHVVLAVRDFDAAVVAYEALLGRVARRTEPANGAVRAWFKLGNVALEVIAPAGDGVAGERVRERLAEHGEGPSMLAFAVTDLDAAGRRLARRGVSVGPIQGSSFNALAASPASTHGVPMVIARFETFPPARALSDGAGVIDGLDHVLILTANPERAVALYGGRLGLDLRLDRTQPWGARQLFFRCGGLVVEIVHPTKDGVSDGPDRFGGYAWRTADAGAAHARLAAAGFAVSELRGGRKPGTRVFTVKNRTFGAPTIVMDAAPADA